MRIVYTHKRENPLIYRAKENKRRGLIVRAFVNAFADMTCALAVSASLASLDGTWIMMPIAFTLFNALTSLMRVLAVLVIVTSCG